MRSRLCAPVFVLGVFGACECEPADPIVVDLDAVARHDDAAFMGVGGSGADDVWIVGAIPAPGQPPVVLHSDGDAFDVINTGQAHDLWWVHGFDDAPGSPTFIGGSGATLLRLERRVGGGYDVARLDTPGFAGQTVFGVWGPTPTDIWAVGGFAGRAGFVWRSDGQSVRDEPIPLDVPRAADGELPALLKAWGRGPQDVWIVGGLGTIMHSDGGDLVVVNSGISDTLFTVTGNDREVVIVGGGAAGVVLRGGLDGFVDDTPPGAPLLQGVTFDGEGTLFVAGAGGFLAGQKKGSDVWQRLDSGVDAPSIHALWDDGQGGLYAVGGQVLTPALDVGQAVSTVGILPFTPPPPPVVTASCPAGELDPAPNGSTARRIREQLLNAIRRAIPDPPFHARNLFHTSAAMWDAYAAYGPERGAFVDIDVDIDAILDVEAERNVAVAVAGSRIIRHRYANAQGAETTLACLDDFLALVDIAGADVEADAIPVSGDDGVSVGLRVAQAIIDASINDGANEAGAYADTTDWQPTNPVLIVDRPGVRLDDPDTWQQLNLALAETQNGIVLDESVQPYLGPQWGAVRPFAMRRDDDTGRYSPPTDFPSIDDETMVDEVVEVIRLTAQLDATDDVFIDISPGARGNNTLGTNDGVGHDENPITGAPYAPNLARRGDFLRVIAEMWADGPKSETPPGHWMKLAHDVTDEKLHRLEPLVPYGEGEAVSLLAWDTGLGLAVAGATHDAAIAAWELKRDSLGPRPISLVRFMGQKGQRSDPALPSYDEGGLPLIDGLIELISPESCAPGERHFHLRHFQGEIAVLAWPGEPGDRANSFTPVQWMRVKDWIPYQRRTFVTPAFPGFISGHSTFSRAAAEALTAYTGSPFFPGGLAEFIAPASGYLIFEDGPLDELRLQWATYYDAADQSGQSRLAGGIHVFADDTFGRVVGSAVGQGAAAAARALWEPTP